MVIMQVGSGIRHTHDAILYALLPEQVSPHRAWFLSHKRLGCESIWEVWAWRDGLWATVLLILVCINITQQTVRPDTSHGDRAMAVTPQRGLCGVPVQGCWCLSESAQGGCAGSNKNNTGPFQGAPSFLCFLTEQTLPSSPTAGWVSGRTLSTNRRPV